MKFTLFTQYFQHFFNNSTEALLESAKINNLIVSDEEDIRHVFQPLISRLSNKHAEFSECFWLTGNWTEDEIYLAASALIAVCRQGEVYHGIKLNLYIKAMQMYKYVDFNVTPKRNRTITEYAGITLPKLSELAWFFAFHPKTTNPMRIISNLSNGQLFEQDKAIQFLMRPDMKMQIVYVPNALTCFFTNSRQVKLWAELNGAKTNCISFNEPQSYAFICSVLGVYLKQLVGIQTSDAVVSNMFTEDDVRRFYNERRYNDILSAGA